MGSRSAQANQMESFSSATSLQCEGRGGRHVSYRSGKQCTKQKISFSWCHLVPVDFWPACLFRYSLERLPFIRKKNQSSLGYMLIHTEREKERERDDLRRKEDCRFLS